MTLLVLVPAIVLLFTTPVHGRHNFSMLRVNPELGMSGGEVAVSGFSYPANAKVSIRFNGLDGPVLAELEPNFNQDISGTVRLPEGTPTGRYLLYAVQYDAEGKPNRIPGRASVTIVTPGGGPPALPTGLEPEVRPQALAKGGGARGGELALVALGAFGVAAFVTGIAVARRPS
jgi:hypothetical protein